MSDHSISHNGGIRSAADPRVEPPIEPERVPAPAPALPLSPSQPTQARPDREAPRRRRRKRRSLNRALRDRLSSDIDALLAWQRPAAALDPNGVHQMRRATRRLRAALRLFRPALDPLWAGSLFDELRWLAHQLGTVRDLDVVRDHLFHPVPDRDDHPSITALREAFDENHRLARAALADTFAGRRYPVLLDKLREAARHPWLRGDTARPARKFLRPRVCSLWKKCKAAHEVLALDPSDEAYHRLRRRAKDLRLGLDAATPHIGRRKKVKRLDRRVGRLLDLLGDRQDAVVAARLVEVLADGLDHSNPPDMHHAVETLIDRQQPVILDADHQFPRAWRDIRRAVRDLLESW